MDKQVIDLTLPFTDGERGVQLEPELSIASDGFNTTTVHVYSHALTHMDAPKHFIDGGTAIETIPLDRCVGSATVIDLIHKTPNSQIMIADILPHEKRVTAGVRLLLRTDWSLHAGQDDYRTHFPRISPELARWFVDRNVRLVGVETPSVASLAADKRDELTEVHQTLLGANIVIVEGLCNLHVLPQQVEFVALPLKLMGCDGSPVRAIAIINDNQGDQRA